MSDTPPPPGGPHPDMEAPQGLPSPHAAAIGLVTLASEEGSALLKVAYRPDLVGDPDTGVVAGGVVTTLLDHACGHAVMRALGRPLAIATLDLRIDYMRGAEPGRDLLCRARCYKLTRSVAFVRAAAFETSEEDPVATAQAAFMLNSSASGRAGSGGSRPR